MYWGADDLVETGTLCVSELATNALLHARTPFHVTMTLEPPELTVEVCDGSSAPPRLTLHPIDASYGRGLQLVQTLSAEWGWEPKGTGKVVWFRLTSQHKGSNAH
jgi:hypothetical protein